MVIVPVDNDNVPYTLVYFFGKIKTGKPAAYYHKSFPII